MSACVNCDGELGNSQVGPVIRNGRSGFLCPNCQDTTPDLTKCCASCPHRDALSSTCRAHAPTAALSTLMQPKAQWPVVRLEDWCQQHPVRQAAGLVPGQLLEASSTLPALGPIEVHIDGSAIAKAISDGLHRGGKGGR